MLAAIRWTVSEVPNLGNLTALDGIYTAVRGKPIGEAIARVCEATVRFLGPKWVRSTSAFAPVVDGACKRRRSDLGSGVSV